MDPPPNQSPLINRAHAVTLTETPHSRMVDKRPANQNRPHLTPLEPRTYTTTISIHEWKDRDNRTVYPPPMVDTIHQNKNRGNEKRRERPACNLSSIGRCESSLINTNSCSRFWTSTINACLPTVDRPSSMRDSIRFTSQIPTSVFVRHSPLAKPKPVTPIR